MNEQAPTLVQHLKDNPGNQIIVFWSVYHKQFRAELYRRDQNNYFEVVTIGIGDTVDDAISVLDTTLLAETLRNKPEGVA